MAKIKGLNEHNIIDNYVVLIVKRRNGQILEGYVSLSKLERLKKLNWCWCASWKKNIKGYYLQHTEYLGTVDKKPRYKIHTLHQLIMPNKSGFIVDHKNHNGLDCRDDNLRYLSNANNVKSRNGLNKNNTSGYRNVTWSKREKKWSVLLRVNGRNKAIGRYKDAEEAGRMAEEARQKYYGIDE